LAAAAAPAPVIAAAPIPDGTVATGEEATCFGPGRNGGGSECENCRGHDGYAGDDLVNFDGVESFVNHQGVRDGQHRRAMSNDQRLGLGEGKHQIGVDGGLRRAYKARQRAGLPDVAMCDPGFAIRVQQGFRSGAAAQIDAPDVDILPFRGSIACAT
jgi:hypothetical protein